jgi:uncharacterized ion transporter superfamily protein YfcC
MIATTFAGAKEMFSVAMLIGVAASIGIVLENSGLNAFFIGGLAEGMSGLDPMMFFLMIFIVFIVMSFAIPSTSGLAAATMPIMAPLVATQFSQITSGDAMGGVVFLFSIALGAVNMFIPTQAVVMAQAESSRVGFGRMVKVTFPYAMGTLLVSGAILIPTFGMMF